MAAAPERLVIFGSGGHARVLLEAAAACWPGCEIVVVDDDPGAVGRDLLGNPVRGGRDWLMANLPTATVAPALGNNGARAGLIEWLAVNGQPLATVVHPSAVISPSAHIGEGAFVAPGAVINAQARIGRGAIVNTSASVDHDCVIGECAHIGPGANLCGGVVVGDLSLVGVGSAILPGIRIGSRATIGGGSSVTRDVPDGARVAGTPALPLRND